MKLKDRIQEDMKDAMRSGDSDQLKVIRLILSAVKQIEIDTRKTIEEDSEILTILNKMVKQRRDSITQFEQGNRKDLAEIELTEITVLEKYLPEQLSENEIDELIDQSITESSVEDITKMGAVMSILKEKVSGRADMGIISQKVKARLSKTT
ncbi:MAG: GatB/YqeY domain-containing protein [Pseudomonadota bacterium]|nr:GatB/YqeY domain-containing protein [Pseudomonadota bacterium]